MATYGPYPKMSGASGTVGDWNAWKQAASDAWTDWSQTVRDLWSGTGAPPASPPYGPYPQKK